MNQLALFSTDGWPHFIPALTIAFFTNSDRLAGFAVGDKIDFDVTVRGCASDATTMRKPPLDGLIPGAERCFDSERLGRRVSPVSVLPRQFSL